MDPTAARLSTGVVKNERYPTDRNVGMFLRFKRVRGREYLLLVENYRENGKVKQRTMIYFGPRDQLDLVEVRRRLARMPGYHFMAVPNDE